MSGHSDSVRCPRCGADDALQTSSDYKPFDQVSGTCSACGFQFWTDSAIAGLEEVNELRAELELEPLTELAKPFDAWLQYGYEPKPGTPLTISKRDYGRYEGEGYGSHTQELRIGGLWLMFSYDTVVAFNDGAGLKVCQNTWGTTTGKHLNWIDGGNRKSRIEPIEFNHLLQEALKKHNLAIT